MPGETGYAASFLVARSWDVKSRSSLQHLGNAYTSNQHPKGLGVFRVCSWAVTEPQLTAVAHPAITAVLPTAQQLCGQGCSLSACKPAHTLGLRKPPWRHSGNPCSFQCGPSLLDQRVLRSWSPGHLLIRLPQFQSQIWSGARDGWSPPRNAFNLCFPVLILKAQAFGVGVV